MTIVFWCSAVLLVLTSATSALFFVLHISTGEAVPLVRAKVAYRWAVVVVLGTFDIWIFHKVFLGIKALMA